MFAKSLRSSCALGLSVAFFAAGCGGSGESPVAATATPAPLAAGAASVAGTVVADGMGSSGDVSASSSSGIRVSALGTAAVAVTDAYGEFHLPGLPAGVVTLRFEGPGCDAKLEVGGLVDGQTVTVNVRVQGAQATVVAPAKGIDFSGALESLNPPNLSVAGRRVTTDGRTVVKRGDKRISLEALRPGEKVHVAGTVGAGNVVLASEIGAEEGSTKPVADTHLSGKVDSVSPFRVAGTKVHTDGGTRWKWSDGTPFSTGELRVGQRVDVEGARLGDGSFQASKVVVDCNS